MSPKENQSDFDANRPARGAGFLGFLWPAVKKRPLFLQPLVLWVTRSVTYSEDQAVQRLHVRAMVGVLPATRVARHVGPLAPSPARSSKVFVD